ncbi:ATP-binding protein [Sphingomonas sp. 1P06PA]|uniref:ATP-binding protein n=1 Tax=Sphingomonas sp. 1P06PA TaxID=554121 RepID=UPI0039A59C86
MDSIPHGQSLPPIMPEPPAKAIHLCAVTIGPRACQDALDACRFFVGSADVGAIGDKLAILVEELVMNLVDHAGLPPEDRIDLRFFAHDDGVRLVIEDGGRPFDPRDAAAPHDPDRIGGAGLHMLARWARIEAYDRIGQRNRLRLLVPVVAATPPPR